MNNSKLARLRGSKGITQVELSQTSKVNRDIISKLENGAPIKRFSDLTIGKLAKTFNMNFDDFIKYMSS